MSVMLAYHSQLPFARGAFLGLSQFFTLSGFLITGLLLHAQDGDGIHLRTFWSRRFRRLMPAALVCLAGIVVFGMTVATYQQAQELPGHIAAAATYVANWHFIVTDKSYIDLFAEPSPVQHYWSLAVEEQFYLLMPLVMLGLMRLTRSPKILAGAFGGMAVVSTGWMIHLYRSGAGLDRIYYGTDTRMAEILMGGLLAVVLYHTPRVSLRALKAMGAIGVVAYLITAWGSTTLPLADGPIWQGGFLAFAAISCLVIMGVISERGPLTRVLSFGPLPAIGRLTYGLYLYHWPIFLWLTPERTGLDPWPLFALRVALTFAVATASYHWLEMPVRTGVWPRRSGRLRLVAGPAAMAAVILGGFLFTNTDAKDPLATLRGEEASAPVVESDGVLDLLVITDEAGEALVDHMEELAADRDELRMVRASPLRCAALVGPAGGRVCENWAEEWPDLIRNHNPDAVLVHADAWPAPDKAHLPDGHDAQVAFITEVVGSGFDLLSVRGAPVIWTMSGTDFAGATMRSQRPFYQALHALEQHRGDVRRIIGGRLPPEASVGSREYLETAAEALFEDAHLYRRAEDSRLPRVMIIGDSQARSLGYGLERWGAESDSAVVWNVATEGCGLAPGGMSPGVGRDEGPSQRCLDAVDLIPSKVEEFEPDIVVILTSMWDIHDRSHPSWEGRRTVGDPEVNSFLRGAYEGVLDAASADGARSIWMTAPCTRFAPVPGTTPDLPDAFAPERSRNLNRMVIEPMVADRADEAAVFDLDAVLCPDGSYINEIDGVSPIRSDGIHFSVDGAMWFAERYGEELLELGGRR